MRFSSVAAYAAIGIALGLSGCGASDEGSDAAPAASKSATPTTVPIPSDTPTTIDPKGVERGGVVHGFPLKLIPKLPHADIKRTADVVDGKFRRLSMSGTTERNADEVLKFYAEPLKKAGFDQMKTKKADKSKSTIFSRSHGKEILTVTITRSDDGTNSFTVGGQIKK